MIYKMTLADSTDSMTFDLLEVPIADKDIEGAVDNTLVNGNVFTDYLWLKKQWTQKWALMCDDEYTQLRGFYTRQWENAEAPTYRLFYGNNITEDVMRNGSYITENIDAPLGAEMSLTQLSGNAEQNGTPTPDAPVSISTVTGEQTMEVVGKNLASVELSGTSRDITFTSDGSGLLTMNGTSSAVASFRVATLANYMHLKAGQTYTLSANNPEVNSSVTLRFAYPNGVILNSGTTMNAVNKTFTFTPTADAVVSIEARIASGTTLNNFTVKPQLELGSTATAYEPYQGQEFPIDLDSIELAKVGNYQDRIYKDDGKWYIEKQVGKVVYDGSENWSAGEGGGNRRFTLPQSAEMMGGSGRNAILSDYFNTNSGNAGGTGFIYQQRIYLYWGTMDNTASDFKTWLSTHPTTVYYALATPTTTEITDEALLAQLNFLASLYGGVNHISLVGTGAQGEMEVKIHKIYEQETEIYPQTAVRLTLTDGGIVNPCGCRKDVQIKMRETIQ